MKMEADTELQSHELRKAGGCWQLPELGKGQKGILPQPPEGTYPNDILIWDFQPSELGENTCLPLGATQLVKLAMAAAGNRS